MHPPLLVRLVASPDREIAIRPGKRQTQAFIVGMIAALAAAVPVFAQPPTISSKEAEAQQVLAQVQELDSRLEKAIEAYNLANVKLGGIVNDLRVNRHELEVARSNLHLAQRTLADRLVQIYQAGSENSTLEVLLGATSLDDLVTRIDAVDRVSTQDGQVLTQVISFRKAVRKRELVLKRARSEQRRVVAQRASFKESIHSQLHERERLLSSIKSEIAHLQAVERARQAALARRLQAHLEQARAQQQAALEQAAVGATATTPEGVTVAPPSRYGGVVGIAMQYLGVPYVWGGSSPGGFDCSGFTSYVYAQIGVSLPHNAAMQYAYGTPVSRDQLEPGDLVFFNGLGHEGLYVGGGQFIHAPHTGDVVKISSIYDSWYASRWVGAKRL